MVVNKTASLVDGKFHTGSHEFLHTMLYNTIGNDSAIGGLLGAELLDLVDSDGVWKDTVNKEDGTKKSAAQNKAEFEALIWGAYDSSTRGEEVLTNLSDFMARGAIEFNDATYKGYFKNMITRLLQRVGIARDIKFDEASDIKDFLVNYNRSIKKNYTNRTIQRSLAKGIEGKIIDEGRKMSKEDAIKKGRERSIEWRRT